MRHDHSYVYNITESPGFTLGMLSLVHRIRSENLTLKGPLDCNYKQIFCEPLQELSFCCGPRSY